MNCFVASAYGHSDTDAIYDQAICSVLKEMKIRPLRADRVEHNDDIDDRIFLLIDQSQLCIADLTYARPSVYYEAGYAFASNKPVVYIARGDHFKPREDDREGNLRVHFDLQMKNIIKWTTPNDAFKRRLRSRLRYVTRPLLREQKIKAASAKAIEDFSALSVVQQMEALKTKAENQLRARGYSRHHRSDLVLKYDPYHSCLEKRIKGGYRQVHLFVRTSLSKSEIDRIYRHPPIWIPFISREDSIACKELESAVILVSLRPMSYATLRNRFPAWSPVGKRAFTHTLEHPTQHSAEYLHTIRTIVIDGPSSIREFASTLREHLDEWEGR